MRHGHLLLRFFFLPCSSLSLSQNLPGHRTWETFATLILGVWNASKTPKLSPQMGPPQLLFPLSLKFYTWSRVNKASCCTHPQLQNRPRPAAKYERNTKNEELLTTKSGRQKQPPKMESPTISFKFLLVKRFGSHFSSQKTTTKIGAAKVPTFPNFVAVWTSFYPKATAHAATHTTLVSSETAPRLFQACPDWRLHRGGPIVRPWNQRLSNYQNKSCKSYAFSFNYLKGKCANLNHSNIDSGGQGAKTSKSVIRRGISLPKASSSTHVRNTSNRRSQCFCWARMA